MEWVGKCGGVLRVGYLTVVKINSIVMFNQWMYVCKLYNMAVKVFQDITSEKKH